jgi:hypothetical protein
LFAFAPSNSIVGVLRAYASKCFEEQRSRWAFIGSLKYSENYTFFYLPLDFRLVALMPSFANIHLEKLFFGNIADKAKVGGGI